MSTRTAPSTAPLWFIDGLVHIHVSGEETEGRYALLESHVPQGDMPPLHVHHEEDEVFHVLDGEVTLFLPGEQVSLSTGETLRAPRGIPHTYRVESPGAQLLVFCAPARFDGFVRASPSTRRRRSCRPAVACSTPSSSRPQLPSMGSSCSALPARCRRIRS
jgi:quercetin dioxygenase-like cupin family protein